MLQKSPTFLHNIISLIIFRKHGFHVWGFFTLVYTDWGLHWGNVPHGVICTMCNHDCKFPTTILVTQLCLIMRKTCHLLLGNFCNMARPRQFHINLLRYLLVWQNEPLHISVARQHRLAILVFGQNLVRLSFLVIALCNFQCSSSVNLRLSFPGILCSTFQAKLADYRITSSIYLFCLYTQYTEFGLYTHGSPVWINQHFPKCLSIHTTPRFNRE